VGVLESEEHFKQEVHNMQLVNHPNVLNCWNAEKYQEQGVNKYWISMPNMGSLTLEHLIFDNALDLKAKLLILMQIVDALKSL
jgi:serine/threonine protein kinase